MAVMLTVNCINVDSFYFIGKFMCDQPDLRLGAREGEGNIWRPIRRLYRSKGYGTVTPIQGTVKFSIHLKAQSVSIHPIQPYPPILAI